MHSEDNRSPQTNSFSVPQKNVPPHELAKRFFAAYQKVAQADAADAELTRLRHRYSRCLLAITGRLDNGRHGR